MKSPHSFTRAFALASLMTSVSLAAHAEEIPLNSEASNEHFQTQVLAVDSAKHQVTIEGLDKRPVPFQLTDQAKALHNLKVGDKVDIRVTRSIDYVLDTDVNGKPAVSNDTWVNRASPDNLPGGEMYRTVKVTLKVTGVDVTNHQVALLHPDGSEQVVTVVDPKVQAKLKDFRAGQTVDAIHTEVLKVETSR
ncbi:hypothetical protein DKY63_08195 [Pseudomonas putida]|uniref:Uncharacterized protein n=1 Tax=Pseudomonas putida TaxID=303 RepID=A0A2Z4RFU1_PSEPU|nr:hypothetical protein [Pseudomonas putida]AWY39882.1 hypothetical protein DKY63_08195 [Pseudomonas putida]